MSQWVFIEASDVWLFRDNKPFSAQQNFVARGQFPPTPMTMQGVVRTHYLESQLLLEGRTWDDYRRGNVSARIVETVGLPAFQDRPIIPGALHMTGPFVARRNKDGTVERLLHAPLDVLKHENGECRLLKPSRQQNYDFKTDPPFSGWRPLVGGGEGYKEAHGWLTETQYARYLKGDISSISKLLSDDDVFQIEDRVGLALDYGRRANAESMFYRAEFIRPCDQVGLLIHVNLDLFEKETGYLNLGGESRSGHFRVMKSVNSLPQTGRGNVKIVLLTPAYFTQGWMPAGEDWSHWVGSGRLVSIAVGKPHLISGWDMAKNEPKPLRHYIPAGSVFFFENAEVSGKPFTETPPDSLDHGAMGFGTFAAGTW